jgi:hypothetical protein
VALFMPQFQTNLEQMVARVLAVTPMAQPSEVVNQINGRIRSVIASRLYWSDLLVQRVISLPNAYTTGTISFTTGSNMAVGSGTLFPIDDLNNTTSTTAVQDFGYQEITPASMVGIQIDSMLLCDSGVTPEAVAVIETTPVSFWAKFNLSHAVNFTITSSSLAGRQVYSGSGYPVFTIRSVRDASTLELDQPWGGPPLVNSTYQIFKQYTTVDPNLKILLDVVDQNQGTSLDIYTPMESINQMDPQRSLSGGDPMALIQAWPTEAGSMQYEVYPPVTTARQLTCLCGLQWPQLRMDTDRPPWFIDPNIFTEGAIADSLRIKNLRQFGAQDPYFNPDLAMTYEQLFRLHLQECVNADEAKAQRAFSFLRRDLFPGGNWGVNHDSDLFMGRW